ncbi:hypothetical protein [Sphingomonas profundi]|uniref:hypothetical protein n=1 Tax=Alterirhizorhabdus profundi TaxID=2681549 RepID=UPI0012E6F3AA|nr:hypothetical protein [Sphingomonas profundi]
MTYGIALLATLPASLVVPAGAPVEAIGGTVWRGDVALPGGNRVAWAWAPLRSLGRLGFAVDLAVTGPRTALGGRALLRPGAVQLDNVAGRADGALLAAALPGLPFSCDLALAVDVPHAAIGGEAPAFLGRVRGDPGTCRPKAGGAATATPALIATGRQEGADARITVSPQGQTRTRFVEVLLAPGGALNVTVTAEGARALPFAAPAGGMSVSTEL